MIDYEKDKFNQPNHLESDQAKLSVEMNEYLTRHGWSLAACGESACDRKYYVKPKYDTGNCQRYECSGYRFLERKERKSLISLISITKKAEQLFLKEKTIKVNPLPIIKKHGSTLFTGTCGQYYDDVFFLDKKPQAESIFLAQPVVRLQGEDLVGKIDGISTSFVNMATEKINANQNEHLELLNLWMSFLSSLGIFMGDITLTLKQDKPKWGDQISPEAFSLKINYLGLELGIANFFHNIVIPNSGNCYTLSDISFGLERVAWAVNKTPSYFDSIGPIRLASKGKDAHTVIDRYRTGTLLTSSGVIPSYKDRGSKVRKLIKDISFSVNEDFSEQLIKHYFDSWSQFIDLPLSLPHTTQVIMKEFSRNQNMRVNEKLKVSHKEVSPEQNPEQYLSLLLDRGIISVQQIYALFEGD